ncbi:MAG: IS110 family transposase [Lysobacterales bacterium]
MTTSSVSMENQIVAYVGLDWADQQHLICWQAAGSAQVETAVVRQRPEELQAWVAQRRLRFPGGLIAIALEQSRGAVIAALMHYDFLRLYPINPKSLARYREAFYSSGAKDDPNDAALLLDLLVKHRDRFSPWVPDDPLSRQLALRVEHRRQLVDLQTELTHKLNSHLKLYFPQALDWAGEIDSLPACDFLQRWPTLQAVQKARPAQLEKFYNQHHCRRPQLIQQRIEQIRQAQPLTQDTALVEASYRMVLALGAQLRALIPTLGQWQQEISQLFAQHPDAALFASFPGAGPVLAPRLEAAFGSRRDRFSSAQEILQFSGVAPVTQRSGKSCQVHRRWARPKFLHQSFVEFAAFSIPHCGWARALYQQLRARGQRHWAAIRMIAYKWIRILFRCWKDRVPYDEQKYLKSLQRRNPRLWAAIQQLPECSKQPAA